MSSNFLHRSLIAALWLSAAGSLIFWARSNDYGLVDAMAVIYEFVSSSLLGPLIYIVIYALRPLIFFPAMWLTILSGSVFGFWWGTLYTIIGENASASVAYFLGRYFKPEDKLDDADSIMERWKARLDEHAFVSVFIMRAIYLPFDLVNYGCGFLGVRWRAYALATLLGIMPGLVVFSSFGASVHFPDFLAQFDDFDPSQLFDTRQLVISGALFAASLLFAAWVKKRHTPATTSASTLI